MTDPKKGYGYTTREDPPTRAVPFGTPDSRITAAPSSEPRRTAVGVDRATTGFSDVGGELAPTASDHLGRLVDLFFAKGLPGDPDTLDSVLDGLLYRKRFPQLTIGLALVSSSPTAVVVLAIPVDPYGGTPTLTWAPLLGVVDNGDDTYTIARNAPGGGMRRVTFLATLANRLDATAEIDIPEQQGSGPDLDVRSSTGSTTSSITWGGDSVELSIDGAAYGTPPASPITVSRSAAGGAWKVYTFRGTANGQSVTNTVNIPPLDADTVTPDLTVVPATPGATAQDFAATATNPKSGGAAPTLEVTPRGTTAFALSVGPIADGVTATIASGETVTVDRPPNGSPPATVTFDATLTGGGRETIQRTIIPQGFGPSLEVTPTEDATTVSIEWDAIGSVEYRIDGGSWTTPPASPFTVSRNAAGGATKTVDLRATLDGQTQSHYVLVRPQDAGGGTVPPSIDFLVNTGKDNTSNYLTLEWGVSNEPASETYDLRWRWKTVLADGTITGEGVGTDTAVTSPHNWNPGVLNIMDKGDDPAWEYLEVSFHLRMKNSGGTIVATIDALVTDYAIYTP